LTAAYAERTAMTTWWNGGSLWPAGLVRRRGTSVLLRDGTCTQGEQA